MERPASLTSHADIARHPGKLQLPPHKLALMALLATSCCAVLFTLRASPDWVI